VYHIHEVGFGPRRDFEILVVPQQASRHLLIENASILTVEGFKNNQYGNGKKMP
jgi:hypothetical protein